MKLSKSVDEYIGNAPKEVKSKLLQIRDTIVEAAPDSIESISYAMPFYGFRGESGFRARLCYFGLLKSKKKIVFYTRPLFLEEHLDEAKKYMTSKSALQFSLEGPIPLQLIRKVVRDGVRKHKMENRRTLTE